ncbi:MAG: YbaB/EbfC family nucleoid-associated protein [Pseudonocardiales bacterium]
MSDSVDEFFRRMGIPRHDEDPASRPLRDSDSGSQHGQQRAEPAARTGSSAPDEPGSIFHELGKLRRDAEDLQRRFAVDPAALHQGSDGTGSVAVTIDSEGRVTDVHLKQSWRHAVGEQSLGAAVLDAVTDAGMRRLAAWGADVAAVAADGLGPYGPPDPAPQENTSVAAFRTAMAADSTQTRQAVQELVSLLQGVETELDDLERRVDRRLAQNVVGVSPSHLVKVTVTGGGQVTDVGIQPRFLKRTDDPGIARELRSAFQAAYERVGALGLQGLLGDGPLARLHALGEDPAGLLGKLGLDSRGAGGESRASGIDDRRR